MKNSYCSCSTFFILVCILFFLGCKKENSESKPTIVSDEVMNKVYEEIKTPYKYGLVLLPENSSKMVDSPSVFKVGDKWYMTYIVFDGKGYETLLATSDNLLDWTSQGKLMSFTENTWDANQKAGYIALQDFTWGGTYEVNKYDNKYWMSYLGGATEGYEAGILGIGIANTGDLTMAKEWNRIKEPVMLPSDSDARWYDNYTIYKSSVIYDKDKTLEYPFVMFYNAKNKEDEVQVIRWLSVSLWLYLMIWLLGNDMETSL